MHTPYDTGGRKPPLSQSTQQPASYESYDTGQPATNTAMSMGMAQINDIVIVHTIPTSESEINDIACISLSGNTGHLRESQSFSVFFGPNDPFQSFAGHADYIRDCLDNRIWIVDNEDHERIIGNSFKRLARGDPPRPSQLINVTQLFESVDIRRSILYGSVNARIRCNEVYSTLQRLALMNYLSLCLPTTNVMPNPTMPMASTNDTTFAPPPHDSITESTQWNTTTTDNNFEPTVSYPDQGHQGPTKNDFADPVPVGASDTHDDPNYDRPRPRYNVHDPSQQQPDVVPPEPPMDAEPPMMANDVHDPPPPQQQPQQQQPQVQQQAVQTQTYEPQSNGGGHPSGHGAYRHEQDLAPSNNQEMTALSGTGHSAVSAEDVNGANDLSSSQQVIPADFVQPPPPTGSVQQEAPPPPQQQQALSVPDTEATHNGAANEMNATMAVPEAAMAPTTTTTAAPTMAAVTDEAPMGAPSSSTGKTPKVQLMTHQASPQQALLTPSEKTEESPNYTSSQTVSMSHVMNHQMNQHQQQVAPTRQSSWAALATTGSALAKPSPTRTIKPVDRISDCFKKQKGRSGTKTTQGIRNSINLAINEKRTIWVSYNGHQRPFFPRCIEPTDWHQDNKSFYARQHRSKSGNRQRFLLHNVLEVRSTDWNIPRKELTRLKQRYESQQDRGGRGGGGGYGGGGYGRNQGQGQGRSQMSDGRGQRYGGGGDKRNGQRGGYQGGAKEQQQGQQY